jgi:hypothetical protein
MRTWIVLVALTLSAGALKAEEEHSFWWYARAKIACISDATRLCGSAMPDQDRVTECMKDKKKLVSPSCAEFYPGGKNAD